MITLRDWEKIKKFAETYRSEHVVGPWGWETQNCLPDGREILHFIETEIGIKDHIRKGIQNES